MVEDLLWVLEWIHADAPRLDATAGPALVDVVRSLILFFTHLAGIPRLMMRDGGAAWLVNLLVVERIDGMVLTM